MRFYVPVIAGISVDCCRPRGQQQKAYISCTLPPTTPRIAHSALPGYCSQRASIAGLLTDSSLVKNIGPVPTQ